MTVLRAFLLGVLLLAPVLTNAIGLGKELERVLLRGDWMSVLDVLASEKGNSLNPSVKSHLLGHASLATNHNNESIEHFLAVAERSSSETWVAWTSEFLSTHPDSSVAIFLNADAMARSGRLDIAASQFDAAVELNSRFALALNARGVLHAIQGNLDAAFVDLHLAKNADVNLADAYANLGALGILQEIPARQGSTMLSSFNKAIDLNPRFALAYNGRGCLYFGLGNYSEAAVDFRTAQELSTSMPFAEVNEGLAYTYAAQMQTEIELADRAGSTFEANSAKADVSSNELDDSLLNIVDALPHMSTNDQQLVIDKYGWRSIEVAIQQKISMRRAEILSINRNVAGLHSEQRALSKWQVGLAWAKAALQLRSTAKNVGTARTGDWDGLALQTGKAAISVSSPTHTENVLSSAISMNPASSATSSTLNIIDYALKDRMGSAKAQQTQSTQRAGQIGLEVRNLYRFIEGRTTLETVLSRQPARPVEYRPSLITNVPHTRIDTKIRVTAPPPIQLPVHPSTTWPQYQQPRVTTSKFQPGGVTTKEIMHARIDGGNWPVITLFGLAYHDLKDGE